MRLHRFFISQDTVELGHDIWLKDQGLYKQWTKVLRYRQGDKVVLFDGVMTERLYNIEKIGSDAVHLRMVTDFNRKLPKEHVYLFFSLLKKDKNDWVVQKATELGVRNIVPLFAGRSETTYFDADRARKIAVEASEQCGRSDIPEIREPISIESALNTYAPMMTLYFCNEGADNAVAENQTKSAVGVFIGPEGGWTDDEISQFKSRDVRGLALADFTLRAETACVIAVSKLQ